MKRLIIGLTIFLSLVLTSCASIEEATVDDTDVIAEYTASLLLKYDRSYKEELIDESYLETKPPDTEEVLVDEVGQDIEQDRPKPTTVNPSENEIPKVSSLTDILDNKDIVIAYKNHDLYDSYPVEPEDSYFALEKTEGKKFCVFEFTITNNSSNESNINLVKNEIIYQLKIDSTTYNPLLTLLENDLQLLNVDIKGKSSKIGHLVFEVPKDTIIEKGELYAIRGSQTSNIKLK